MSAKYVSIARSASRVGFFVRAFATYRSASRAIFSADAASLSSDRAKSNSASNMNRGGSARSKKMKSLYCRTGDSVTKSSSDQSASSSRRSFSFRIRSHSGPSSRK